MEMDKDVKVTYITIAVLIIILGGVAFFLQDDTSLPEETVKTAKVIPVKKVIANPSNSTSTLIASSTTSTTTAMQVSEKITRGVITTNKGVIEVSFSTSTPIAVKNFVTLAQSKYYDGVRFHRVIKDFMIQSGDPLTKDPSKIANWGTGGPGYTFKDELTGNEVYTTGTLAMANIGQPNSNGSQFFIVTGSPRATLPPSYTVFGKVTKGMDVAMKIQEIKTTGNPSDRPLEDIIIEKIEVME